MRTGWLVVNGFLRSAKFDALYGLLLDAAREAGAALKLVRTTELMAPAGEPLIGGARPDFVLFWDKDVLLAERLLMEGVPVFNAPDAIGACDDKALTARALARSGVPAPKTMALPLTFPGVGYAGTEALAQVERAFPYPLVVKEAHGSFGEQVYLAADRDELTAILERIGHERCIVQELVQTSVGRDVRVNVVGGRVVACMLRESSADFRSNHSLGGAVAPFDPTPDQVEVALAAAAAVGLDFGGVDLLFGEQGAPLVCEVNSNPQFKSTLDATGIDLAGPIIAHILERI